MCVTLCRKEIKCGIFFKLTIEEDFFLPSGMGGKLEGRGKGGKGELRKSHPVLFEYATDQ